MKVEKKWIPLLTGVLSYVCSAAALWTSSSCPVCLVSGMSEVSLEAESGTTSAEDPQRYCEEADETEKSLSEDVPPEVAPSSRGGEDKADVLYEIDINSDEETGESCSKDAQVQDEGPLSGSVASSRVGSGAKLQAESAGTPKENGDSLSETKVIFIYIHY